MPSIDNISPGELYGDRYNENLKKALQQIQVKLYETTKKGLEKKKDIIGILLGHEREIKKELKETLNDVYNESIKGAYKDAMILAEKGMDETLKGYKFTEIDVKIFKRLRRNNAVWFETFTKETTNEVFDSMMQWALSGDKEMLNPFFFDMDEVKQARYGKTIVKNHINSFSQNLVNTKAMGVGIVRYKYAGPWGGNIRPFCESLVKSQPGKGYTIQEIGVMDNGSTGGGSVFMNRGGYGCRHRWIPLADSIDETIKKENVETTVNKLKNKGVKFGDKPSIFIKNKAGEITGTMSRVIKRDKQGYFYNRFDGSRQGITKKDDSFIYKSKL